MVCSCFFPSSFPFSFRRLKRGDLSGSHRREISSRPSPHSMAKLKASIPPRPMMHFAPISDFPLFQNILQRLGNFFQKLTFLEKHFVFIHQILLWPSFNHWLKIFNFLPISAEFINPPLISEKNLISPCCYNFPLFQSHLSVFATLSVFCFLLFWPWCIYASCNTRTGRLWQRCSDVHVGYERTPNNCSQRKEIS